MRITMSKSNVLHGADVFGRVSPTGTVSDDAQKDKMWTGSGSQIWLDLEGAVISI